MTLWMIASSDVVGVVLGVVVEPTVDPETDDAAGATPALVRRSLSVEHM